MYFSLHSLPANHPAPACFFWLHTGNWTVYSPLYPDRAMAIVEMEKLILRLRRAAPGKLYAKTSAEYTIALRFFGRIEGVIPSFAEHGELELPEDRLEQIQSASNGNTFRILFYELIETTEVNTLSDVPPARLSNLAAWAETGSSLLHIGNTTKGIGFKPSLGGQLSPNVGPCSPVFNALQPFVNTDIALFKGRKREVKEIHTLLKSRSVLLIYGPARCGKTSLLQCGLSNFIKTDDADLLMVPCGGAAVFDRLETTLQVHLTELGVTDISPEAGPLALALRITRETDRRQYLVFDQLEDILAADVFDADRAALLGFIKNLTETEPDAFRIILSLREEFLAPLAEQEKHLPDLLGNRFRLLPLRENSMVNASVNLLDFLKADGKITGDDSQVLSEKICHSLADPNGNVAPHCLQIYLHQLHQKSCRETKEGPVPITLDLVDRLGPPQTLIDEFYQEQIGELESQRAAEDIPNPFVENGLQELRSGRRDCGCGEDNNNIKAVAATPVPVPAIGALGWVAALLCLPLGALLAWWLLPADASAPPSACELLEQEPGNCTAYVNYLCSNTGDSVCSPSWLATTDLEDCEVWRDYKNLTRRESCITYQAFYHKYRDQGICMDFVQPKLLSWECPLVVDTLRLTVRDTIIRRVPSSPSIYGPGGATLPQINNTPDCQLINNINLKSVGPLLISTDPLSGGPYRWEDALTACSERGLRLPCIGEIDFLIEKIYRDDPDRAYSMLAGTGPCNLINPSALPTGRIEFWTATEATDGSAWSFYFDTGLKTIGRQSGTPKSARLPCLCVQKDPNHPGTSLPACYGKQIDRSTE